MRGATPDLPWVTIKYAQTLDGRIATRSGESQWISSADSLVYAHELRASHDAILVGVGTVLRDNPALTARTAAAPRNPARIVLDSTLRIPLDARVLARDGTPVLVATTPRARPEAKAKLEAMGVQVVTAGAPDGRVDPATLLRELGRRGVLSVLVEGGGAVLGAFADARLIDKVMVFVAPMLIGGPAPVPLAGRGVERLADAARLGRVEVRRLDGDVVVEGYAATDAPWGRTEARG